MEATAATELLLAKRYRGPAVAISEGWSELTGLDMDELRRTPSPKLFHPDDIAVLRQWGNEVVSGRSRAPARARVRTRDGSYRFLEFTGICAPDGDLLFYSAQVLATDSTRGRGPSRSAGSRSIRARGSSPLRDSRWR